MKQGKIYLGTNTKMYKTIEETVSFLTELEGLTKHKNFDKMELFVIPSYTALHTAVKTLKKHHIKIGAQNMGWEKEGQFTGEISPVMLQEIGISIVMIGHSERRHIFRETNEEENKKVKAALKYGFSPLLCIGETMEEKEYGISDEILRIQLRVGLSGINQEEAKKIWIAYEPVWSIGIDGVPASKEYANKRHKVIKETLDVMFGEEVGNEIPVMYGGSVNADNAKELIQMPEIEGLFIGRSAWEARNFANIIEQVISC